jgi:sensor histidine kinase YesM
MLILGKLQPISRRLAFSYSLIISLMLLAFIVSGLMNNESIKRIQQIQTEQEQLNKVFQISNELSSLSSRIYLENSQSAHDDLRARIEDGDRTILSLIHMARNETTLGKYIDLKRMFETYKSTISTTVQQVVAAQDEEAFLSLSEVKRISGLIDSSYRDYVMLQQKDSVDHNILISNFIKQQNYVNYFTLAIILILCIWFSFAIASTITDPIHEMVRNASEMANGEFSIKTVNVRNNLELWVLDESFRMMARQIDQSFLESKNQAMLKEQLLKEENENLKMKNLLRESQLAFLQSQINPHFLFNTLNLISQTAYIEGADNTLDLLEATNDLLRCSIEASDKHVPLIREIQLVQDYLFIQGKRFGDRMKFSLNIDHEFDNFIVPSMIIQPLVENSIIHGFKNKQRNCQIDISINRKNDMLSIEVKDNGKGLSQEQIDQFMKHEASDFIEGQKDRIGLGNVIRRLRLFFGVEYVLWISSQPDIETCFELRLPIDASSET